MIKEKWISGIKRVNQVVTREHWADALSVMVMIIGNVIGDLSSIPANILEKGMNPSVPPPAMGK